MTARPALDLAALGPGYVDPVHGAQRSFRALLEAMSRPGRVQRLPASLLAGAPAPGLGVAATAALLALLDAEVRLWLCPTLRAAGTADHLRFHTGVVLVDTLDAADTAVLRAADADPACWGALNPGSDAEPQRGATLLVDAAGLQPDGSGLGLRGPGIPAQARLGVQALGDAFWEARRALQPAYPCGIDLLLCDGEALAALPRTTQVQRTS